jgi:hypothetical protein
MNCKGASIAFIGCGSFTAKFSPLSRSSAGSVRTSILEQGSSWRLLKSAPAAGVMNSII